MAEWSKEVFARNLKFYMDRKDINQKELSEIVGVSAPTVNEWLKAKKFPRIDKIEIMANYFGILKSDLIEDKSVQELIEENPLKMAERHFEILMNEDFTDLFEDFQKLDKTQKKIVADLVHSLAETKKEA